MVDPRQQLNGDVGAWRIAAGKQLPHAGRCLMDRSHCDRRAATVKTTQRRSVGVRINEHFARRGTSEGNNAHPTNEQQSMQSELR